MCCQTGTTSPSLQDKSTVLRRQSNNTEHLLFPDSHKLGHPPVIFYRGTYFVPVFQLDKPTLHIQGI